MRYVHAALTAPLTLQNEKVTFGLLFRASGQTLLKVAADTRHLGVGFFSVLHTWNQRLLFHPHIHCVQPAGGLAPDQFFTSVLSARPGAQPRPK
jgi:Putative transposase